MYDGIPLYLMNLDKNKFGTKVVTLRTMGYYTKFISKELKLRKDTPQEIVEFIDDCVNNHKFDVRFNHKFFTLERWSNIFMSNYWLKEETYFKKEKGQWKLRTAVEINYGREEIL